MGSTQFCTCQERAPDQQEFNNADPTSGNFAFPRNPSADANVVPNPVPESLRHITNKFIRPTLKAQGDMDRPHGMDTNNTDEVTENRGPGAYPMDADELEDNTNNEDPRLRSVDEYRKRSEQEAVHALEGRVDWRANFERLKMLMGKYKNKRNGKAVETILRDFCKEHGIPYPERSTLSPPLGTSRRPSAAVKFMAKSRR